MASVTQVLMFAALKEEREITAAGHKRVRETLHDMADDVVELQRRVKKLEDWRLACETRWKTEREFHEHQRVRRRRIILFGSGGAATGAMVWLVNTWPTVRDVVTRVWTWGMP